MTGLNRVTDFGLNSASLADIATNPRGFGAIGDGVTNDLTALQTAINATPNGGILILPAKTFYLSGSGTQLLLVQKAIYIVGYGATLLIDSAVPNTTDVIRVSPTANQPSDLSGIEGLKIQAKSGTPAQHGIHLDVSNPGQYLSRYLITRCNIEPLGGWGIYLSNPNNMDGFFCSQIEKNIVCGGMYFQRIGDTVSIEKNTITGNNTGIWMSAVSGAVDCVIEKNNITTTGGAIYVDSGNQLKIKNNQCEQTQAYTGSSDAMITINSASLVKIEGNNLNSHGNVAYNIHLKQAYRTSIDGNFYLAGSAGHIEIDSGTSHTAIGNVNEYLNSTGANEIAPIITNNGVGTRGVFVPVVLGSNWVNVGGSYSNFGVQKERNGLVVLMGQAQNGWVTAGTQVAQLPVGFRPSTPIRLTVGTWKTGTPAVAGSAVLVLDTTGMLTIETMDSAVTRLDFDGISFYAP